MVNQRYVLRRNSFIVERIISEQNLAIDFFCRGIVAYRNEIRQDLLADLAGEGLPFADVFLAETFETMAKNFVEENRGGASGEQRWSSERLDEWRLLQRSDLIGEDVDLL